MGHGSHVPMAHLLEQGWEAIHSNTVTLGGRWIWLLNFRKQRGIAQKCKQKTSEKRAQARGKERVKCIPWNQSANNGISTGHRRAKEV